MGEWQPIETAPDNALVLIANSGLGAHQIVIACKRAYSESGWVFQNASPIPKFYQPTHWMPIPGPPSRVNAPASK